MRLLCAIASTATLTLATADSRADGPEPALAVFTGASVLLAGFAVGAVVLSAGGSSDTKNNIGWMTMQTGFALAPLTAHAVVGEWARALAFTAVPAATLGGTGAVLAIDSSAIAHGELSEQRVLWSLLGAGLFSSAAGVVDSAFSAERAGAIAAAPMLGYGKVGLVLQGAL